MMALQYTVISLKYKLQYIEIMLSTSERDFLLGRKEITKRYQRVFRHRIRKKLATAFNDFALLIEQEEKWKSTQVNESELKAKKYLEKLGWHPIKIGDTPDFKCSDGKYVEVKKICSNNSISIGCSQLSRMGQLSKEGNDVFLLVVSGEEIHLFKMKYER
jgi:hypothetical protein